MSIPAALYYAFTGKEPPITHGGAERLLNELDPQ